MIISFVKRCFENNTVIWALRGKPLPPPHKVKQIVIRRFARRNGCKALIETGTFMGDMIYAQRLSFSWIGSIELSSELYENALKRFANESNVHLFCGDSGELLDSVIQEVPNNLKKCFWLDGHYSAGITAKGDKDTPIINELDCIFEHVLEGVILIDDARLFAGDGDYPTIDYLRTYINSRRSNAFFSVKNDIIRVVF